MPDKNTHRLELAPESKTSEGSGRIIYLHPDDPDLIVKLHKPLRAKSWLKSLRYMRRRYAKYLNSVFDFEEWTAIIARTDSIPDFIPGYRGMRETNLGIGAIFEAVRNEQGALAPTLKSFISEHGYSPQIKAAIDVLWDSIEATRCIVSDPNLSNVLVEERGGAFHLWLVDGLGERTLIPIRNWFDWAFVKSARKMRFEMHQAAEGA